MADFNRKKLQVFVSSTYTDLVKERQAAVEAILAAGHIPAGMELFTAGDETQMDVIKQWIDESDVYLLILGGRYGSIEPKTGKSYIHLEYEYAISQNKPLFACIISDHAIEARVKSEGIQTIEMENQQALKAFRTVVLTKMSKFWEDSKDIKITVTETLSHLARRENLIGWVRPNTQSNLPAIADEIARLSKENAQLRIQIGGKVQDDLINGVSFVDLKAILDRKHLMPYLIANCRALATNGTMMNGPSTDLVVLGLLEMRGVYCYLSQAGRAFLNKFEALAMQTEAAHAPNANATAPESE
jgi:hypothetical protein